MLFHIPSDFVVDVFSSLWGFLIAWFIKKSEVRGREGDSRLKSESIPVFIEHYKPLSILPSTRTSTSVFL